MTRARDFSSGIGGAGGNVTLAILRPFLTTANVTELSNLYYTNTRAYANLTLASIDALVDVDTRSSLPLDGQALVWSSINSKWLPGNVTSNLSAQTTDDLPEGNINLYFSNARSRRAFVAGDPTIEIDWNLGTIRANVVAIANAASTTDAVIEGNVNKYFTNARVHANLQLASINDLFDVTFQYEAPANNKVLVYDGALQKWKSGDYNSGRAFFADVAQEANVVVSIANHTTDGLAQGANNLYYTNSRVFSNVSLMSINVLYDVDTTSNLATGKVLGWDGTRWVPVDGGSNVAVAAASGFAELAGSANVAGQANIANVALSAVLAANATYAVTAGYASTAGTANLAANATFAVTANSVISLYNFTTNDLAEGSASLYYTNARVQSQIALANIRDLRDVEAVNANIGDVLSWNGTNWIADNQFADLVAGNLYAERSNVANVALYAVVANTVNSLYGRTTTDLAEGTNLYFTNARAALALTGQNVGTKDLTITGNLLVTGNVVTLDVSNIVTTSKTIRLSQGAASPALALGSGIIIDGANASILYDNTGDVLGVNKSLVVHGNLVPALSGQFDLGSIDKPWRSLFVGAQTLYIGNVKISASPDGGLIVQSKTGSFADVYASNILATESIVINRTTGAGSEFSYIGGNVLQYTSGQTGNLYLGLLKDGQVNKFAGVRVVEEKNADGNVQSSVIIYNDKEGSNGSTARISVLGDGNIVINGNVTISNGTLSGTFSGSIATVSSLANHTTSNLAEGTNQYFTNTRVLQVVTPALTTANVVESSSHQYFTNVRVLQAVNPLLTTSNVIEGTNQYFTNTRVLLALATANTTVNNLTVSGDLIVQGNTVTLNAATIAIEDKNILLANGAVNAAAADGAGISIAGADANITYLNSGDKFSINKNLDVTGNITIGSGIGGNISGLYSVTAERFVGNVFGTVTSLSNHTTSNLAEGANLYFTNARVLANVQQMSINVLADVDITGITLNGILAWDGSKFVASTTSAAATANSAVFAFTAGVANVANYANVAENANIANLVLSLSNHTTNDLLEGSNNLYFTDFRVVGVVTPILTTSNVIEGSNLYFTTSRVVSTVTPLLTTGNVLETTNQYFTNVRALQAVTPLLTTSNVIEGTSQYFTNVRVLQVVTPALTTANVIELDNQYFTNTRVLQAITIADTINPNNVNAAGNINANGTITANAIVVRTFTSQTGDFIIAGNLLPSVAGAFSLGAPGKPFGTLYLGPSTLYLGNVGLGESAGKGLLLSNVTGTLQELVTSSVVATGGVSASSLTSNTATIHDAFVHTLSISNSLIIYGDVLTYGANNLVVSDNMIYLNHDANVSNPDIGISWAFVDGGYQHGGMFRDATDGRIKFYQGYTLEPDANIFIDTSHGSFKLANIEAQLFYGNLIGTVSSIYNHTTTALAEGTNQYFTNTRVLQVVTPALTTANVLELGNQYFTNVRTLQAVTPLLTTSNVIEGTNQYFTNTRVLQAVTPLLTTSNVIEGTNLYYTDARVLANVQQMSVNVFVDVDLTNVSVNSSLIWDGAKFVPGITTASHANTASIANTVVSLSDFNKDIGTSNVTVVLNGAVKYTNTTSVVQVYQFYNETTNSFDTVFV